MSKRKKKDYFMAFMIMIKESDQEAKEKEMVDEKHSRKPNYRRNMLGLNRK